MRTFVIFDDGNEVVMMGPVVCTVRLLGTNRVGRVGVIAADGVAHIAGPVGWVFFPFG